MTSKEYWANRAANDIYGYMEDAEETAKALVQYYITASRGLQEKAKKIFEKYQEKHHLTRKQAEKLLQSVKDPNSMDAIIKKLKQDPQNSELVAEYESQAYGARIRRLTELQTQVDMVTRVIAQKQSAKTADLLQKIMEDAYYHSIFNIQQYTGYGFGFKMLSEKTLSQILDMKWHGGNFSSRIWGNTKKLAEDVKREVMINLLTGRSLHDASKAIDDLFLTGYSNARRLIRTESCFVSNEIHKRSYEECGIEKYIYVAVLDLKTSEVCQKLDGRTFEVKKAQAGTNYPPMHPWCRSTTIAWISEKIRNRMKRRALDPETGRTILIPADMTYKDWFKKYADDKTSAEPESRNLTGEQYDRYRNRLGADFNFTYDEFVRMKEDKEKWEAYQKSYRDSGKSEKYNDMTAVWQYNTKHNKASVSDADHYTALDGTKYDVDNKNVFHKHTQEEEDFAEVISKGMGCPVEMTPEVVGKYKGVKTPDFTAGDGLSERWEEKKIKCVPGKDYLLNEMSSRKAEHYAFDVSNRIDSLENAIRKATEVFSAYKKGYVKSVVLYENKEFIKVLRRK